MEMAQLALQAGYPAEAQKHRRAAALPAGALGTGAEAERHKRLRDLALEAGRRKQRRRSPARAAEAAAAKDGNALVQAGYVYVTMGEADKGIALIEQGIAKGGLKRPEDAKLRLGMAQLQSAKAKAKAQQTLRSVQGSDGSADIARLWAAARSARLTRRGRCRRPQRCPPFAERAGRRRLRASTPASTGRASTPPTCWWTAGRAAFIDTGTNFAVPRLLAALDALGLARDAVDWVIPTHVHLDHAGGAGLLMRELPRAHGCWCTRAALRHMIDPTRAVRRARWRSMAPRRDGARLRHAGAGAGRARRRHRRRHGGARWARAGCAFARHARPCAAPPLHLGRAPARGWFTGDTFGLSYREFDTARGAWILPTSTPVQFEPDGAARLDRAAAGGTAALHVPDALRPRRRRARAWPLTAAPASTRMVALGQAQRHAGAERHARLREALLALLPADACARTAARSCATRCADAAGDGRRAQRPGPGRLAGPQGR